MSNSFDPKEAVTFLSQWYGEAPRLLSAIKPDGAIEPRCFWPQQLGEMTTWITSKVAAHSNIYFSINQPGWALDKRAQKKDIRTVRAFHVDIDPAKDGETPEQCKERALHGLADFSPPPSVVVDSGNGIQALWLLEEPITLDGDEKGWRLAEGYNLKLANMFGGDHCHNIDRIFRVPGTTNFPNKKKMALGRVERPAKLLDSSWVQYPLSQFTPLEGAFEGSKRNASQRDVLIPSSLPRYASTDDLPVKLTDYTNALIVNGCDPNESDKYRSRSEVLWRVLCDMARAGADDETIAAVILDPDFKISASVLDKSNPEQYAALQISKARDEVIDPALTELNARHAIIEMDRGGRCVVMEEDWDEQLQRRKIVFQNFENFRNRYMRRHVEIGRDKNGNPETMPLGKWWLQHPRARQFRKIVFLPGEETQQNVFNLWRGFGCDPKPGDKHLGFLRHIKDNLCGGNEDLATYVIRWLARMVQLPSHPAEVALVIRGKKGTGKGFFGRAICKLLGQHSMHCSSAKYVTGHFNAHLQDCVFLFADEAFLACTKQEEGMLKAMITENTISIEAKGVDATIARNCLHILIASNEEHVIPASGIERRFVVMQADDARMQDSAYFAERQAELDGGGLENLLHHLINLDITCFDHRAIPRTAALLEQVELGMAPLDRWLFSLLDEAILPNNIGAANIAATNSGERRLGLLEDARMREPCYPSIGHRKLADHLKKYGCVTEHLYSFRGWRFPRLSEMRERFERIHGPQRWTDPNLTEWLHRRDTGDTPF